MMVVDLRHWLRPDGSLHPAARHAPHTALVVECATSTVTADKATATSLSCRHRHTRRRCRGTVHLCMRGDTIDWHCSSCDDGGWISGWAGTRWDLSDTPILPDGPPFAVFVTLDELRTLRALELPASIRVVLASAPQVDQAHAALELTEDELELLEHAIVHAPVRARDRSRLDVALGRMEQVRIATALERRPTAH